MSSVGKAKYGNETKKKDYSNANWKVEAGKPNVYRLLPPFKTLAESGRWVQYEAVIWGFKGTNGKQKPFKSIQRKGRNGMMEQDDPAVTWITQMNNDRQEKMDTLKAQGVDKKIIDAKVENLTEMTKQYRVDKGFSANVMRPDGAIGKLKLKIKCKQALDVLFERIINDPDDSIDPIDPEQGIWVDFRRNGEGRDTTYTVDVVYETVVDEKGRKLKSIKPAPLSAKDLERMETESYDLPLSYRELTYDDIQKMVESGGDPAVVDSVFGTPTFSNKTSFGSIADGEDEEEGEEVDAVSMMKASMAKQATPSTKKFLSSISEDEDAPF